MLKKPDPLHASETQRERIYTDGAFLWGSKRGGWAWIIQGSFESKCDHLDHTTNQRMELMAALSAVQDRAHLGPITIVSDSAYVVNCFLMDWHVGWKNRYWKTSAGKPVSNRDLWEPLINLVAEHDVLFEKVKGHSGDEWNDYADILAGQAALGNESGYEERQYLDPTFPFERDGSPRAAS